MTGSEHYRKAEQLLSAAAYFDSDPTQDRESTSIVAEAPLLTAQAQVHATLALTAATAQQLADRYVGDGPHINAWKNTWAQSPARCEELDSIGQQCVRTEDHLGPHSIPVTS